MSPPIEAVTLDFYHTLVRHRSGEGGRGRELIAYLTSQGLTPDPWQHEMLYRIMEPHAREYSPDATEAAKRRYLAGMARRAFECLGVVCPQGVVERHAEAIAEILGPSRFEVFPDVVSALERLRAPGLRLAVISNFHCGLGHFCTELGVGEYLDHVIVSAEVGSAKPDRAIFEQAARLLEIPPGRILHVGDSPVEDVAGARTAGFQAVLIDRFGTNAGATGISSLEELPVTHSSI